MVAAEQAGRDGLEVVQQDRRLHDRVQPQQQVDVVGLAIELSELAAPVEKATKGGAQFLEHRGATLALEPSGREPHGIVVDPFAGTGRTIVAH